MKKYYHFTNIQAATNILTSECIRLTNVEYLNDFSEGQLLFHSSYMPDLSKTNLPISLDEIIANAIRQSELNSLFCLSLTDDFSNLAMWNGYTNDGVAIEFEIQSLSDEGNTTTPAKVDYLTKDEVDKILKDTLNGDDSSNLSALYKKCLELSKNKKPIEFSYENEYRVNYTLSNNSTKNESDVKYFYNGKILKPYLEFGFNELGLKVTGLILSSSITDVRIKIAFERILRAYYDTHNSDSPDDLEVTWLDSFYR